MDSSLQPHYIFTSSQTNAWKRLISNLEDIETWDDFLEKTTDYRKITMTTETSETPHTNIDNIDSSDEENEADNDRISSRDRLEIP